MPVMQRRLNNTGINFTQYLKISGLYEQTKLPLYFCEHFGLYQYAFRQRR